MVGALDQGASEGAMDEETIDGAINGTSVGSVRK